MMRILFFLLSIMIIASCSKKKTNDTTPPAERDYLEVVCFHKRWHDDTWKSVDKYTQATLNKYFSKQMNDNKIVYDNYDLGTSGGARAALKYKTKGSSLIINQWKGNKVIINNITDFAKHTIAKPDSFELGIRKKINALLN